MIAKHPKLLRSLEEDIEALQLRLPASLPFILGSTIIQNGFVRCSLFGRTAYQNRLSGGWWQVEQGLRSPQTHCVEEELEISKRLVHSWIVADRINDQPIERFGI